MLHSIALSLLGQASEATRSGSDSVIMNPYAQITAMGLLAIVLMWVGKNVVMTILNQSFANQNATTASLGASVDKLTGAFEKLDATLDRLVLQATTSASNAEAANERRHAQLMLALETTAKETRHELRQIIQPAILALSLIPPPKMKDGS